MFSNSAYLCNITSFFIIGLLSFSISGCGASRFYAKVEEGSLKGSIVVRWKKPDVLLYEPDTSDPLIFVRSDGEKIVPQKMFTDGGSIPRRFRAFKNYSPWGYAPAFIVHDWLFFMKLCEVDGYERLTLADSALVMSEVMKTMMESPEFDFGDKKTLYLMNLAVKSSLANEIWESGECNDPDGINIFDETIQWDAVVEITFH